MRFNPKPTFCAALLVLAFGAQPASALLIVDTSNAPGVAIDAQYPDDHVFNIPPGSTVRLTRTRRPNARGETHTIAGPYKGTLGEYIRRECWRPGAHCGGTDVIPGGTKGLNPSQGGVRGFKHSE